MTVTALIVILAIVAVIVSLVFFVLISPLSVRIAYRDSLEVFAGLSFVRLKVFPKKKKKKEKKKSRRKIKAKSKDSPETSVQQATDGKKGASNPTRSAHGQDKKDIGDTLRLIFEIIKSVFDVMGRKAEIRIDELRVVVSREDAADTAVRFGLCGGIVSNILAFTSNFGKAVINDKNIAVEPDFVSGKSSLSTDITLSVRTFSLLAGVIRGYLKGISRK